MIETIMLFAFLCAISMFLTILFHEIGHIIILKAFQIPVKIQWKSHHIALSENKYLKKLPKSHLLLIYIMGIMFGVCALIGCLIFAFFLPFSLSIMFFIFMFSWLWLYFFYGCKSDWNNIAWCLNTKK